MKPTYIIIHCSATKDSGTVSWQAIRHYHIGNLGWSDVGYHFGIEQVNGEYEILAGRPLNRMGSHCRAEGMNHKSLGFCFIGDFEHEAPAPEQFALGAKYVAGLCLALGIPPENVLGHRHFEPRKTCPGTAFDVAEFQQLVMKYMEGG